MGKNLSVIYIKDLGPKTGPLAPQPDIEFTHINFFRPTNEAEFLNPLGRFCKVQVIGFPSAGIQFNTSVTTAPFCVVNTKGANASSAPLALFALTSGNNIAWRTSTSNTTWTPWQIIAPPSTGIASGPAASAYVPNRMVLVVRDGNGDVQRGFTNGNTWNGWVTGLGRPSGRVIAGEPAVIGFPDSDFRVYVRTTNNELWYRDFDGTSLAPSWIQVPNASPTLSPEGVDVDLNNDALPALGVANQAEGMNVFYPGTGGALQLVRHTYSGNPPTGQFTSNNYGGVLTTAPGSAYYRDALTQQPPSGPSHYNELHSFVRGADGLLYGQYVKLTSPFYGTGAASGWYSFGFETNGGLGRIYTKPDAVTWDTTMPPC